MLSSFGAMTFDDNLKLPVNAAERIRNLFSSYIDINMRCLLSTILGILINDRHLHQLITNHFGFINKIKTVIALQSPPRYITNAMMEVGVKNSSWQFMTFVTWSQFEDLLSREGKIVFPTVAERVLHNREVNSGSIFSRDSLMKLIAQVNGQSDPDGSLQKVGRLHQEALAQANVPVQPTGSALTVSNVANIRALPPHGYVSRLEQMKLSVQAQAARINSDLTAQKKQQQQPSRRADSMIDEIFDDAGTAAADTVMDDIFSTIDKKMAARAEAGLGPDEMDVEVDPDVAVAHGEEVPDLRSNAFSYGQRARAANPPAQSGDSLRLKRAISDRQFVAEDSVRQRIRDILRGPGSEEVVVETFDIPVTRRLFRSLNPYTWLNDEIINYYMLLLQERNGKLAAHYKETGSRPDFLTSHFYNNFFIDKLLDNENRCYTYSYVRRWSKRFDTFSKDMIFCPINIKNAHWTLAVMHIRERRIAYYDSMGGAGRRYVDGLFRYIKDEHQDKKNCPLPDADEWRLEYGTHSVCPQQENGTDCGVFTICNADFLSDGLPLEFTQAQVTEYWRTKIAASLLRKTLNYEIM